MTSQEGVIKFSFNLDHTYQVPSHDLAQIEALRTWAYEKNLIGVDPFTQIGFGNVSIRHPEGFLITASQTGHLPHLHSKDYCLITETNFSAYTLKAKGKNPPSSEAMTHAVLYQSRPQINSIIHIHRQKMWEFYRNLPHALKAPRDCEYGTKELTTWCETKINEPEGFFVMLGHEEGLIFFAENSERLLQIIKTKLLESGITT